MTVRRWRNSKLDDHSIHCIGNGQMSLCCSGPEIETLFGPPLSTANVLQLRLESQEPLTAEGRREPGRAIWNHVVSASDAPCMSITEYAATDISAIIRQVKVQSRAVRWHILPSPARSFVPFAGMPGVYLQRLMPGQLIYRSPYISTLHAFHWLMAFGCAQLSSDTNGGIWVDFTPGEGSLVIVGSKDLQTGLTTVEGLRSGAVAPHLEATRKYWDGFTSTRKAAAPHLSSLAAPDAEAVDDVAVMLKAQQSDIGATVIGWHAPMGYIRDLYGGSKGMLATGMYKEAKELLLFRWRKFQYWGDLKTAEMIGGDCFRHEYNDFVEGPAYTILQARDFLQATGDEKTIRLIWPMLDWCWQIQQTQLHNGILPFNGDETYIPYGLFPMWAISQGSADTTLAFISAAEWIIPYAKKTGLWKPEQLTKSKAALKSSQAAYIHTFVDGDRIWANHPNWNGPMPRFRWNVCLGGCGKSDFLEDMGHGITLCADCRGKKISLPVLPRMTLHSVSLLPDYLGTTMLEPARKLAIANKVLSRAAANSHIPTSHPDDRIGCPDPGMTVPAGGGEQVRILDLCVGYDPGLMLMTLVKLKHPATEAAYSRMMYMRDGAGVWNEFYDAEDKAVPTCIRANTWASGINIHALVQYRCAQREDGS